MSELGLAPLAEIDPVAAKVLSDSSAEIHAQRADLTPSFSAETLDLISGVEGPIVEVGGDAQGVLPRDYELPSEPTTSDITRHDRCDVDLLADGKQLPFPDSSIAMFMASHISGTDYYDPEVRRYVSERSGNADERFERQDQASVWAEQEYGVFVGDHEADIKLNLRINFIKEMTRAVRPGGLMLFGFISANDIAIANSLGWETVEMVLADTQAYTCLFRMTGKNSDKPHVSSSV